MHFKAVGVVLARIIPRSDNSYLAVLDSFTVPVQFIGNCKRFIQSCSADNPILQTIKDCKPVRLTVYPRTDPDTGNIVTLFCRNIALAEKPHPISPDTFTISGELVYKSKLRNRLGIKIKPQVAKVKPFTLYLKGYTQEGKRGQFVNVVVQIEKQQLRSIKYESY